VFFDYLNLGTLEVSRIPVPLALSHSALGHPKRRNRVLVIEKMGEGIAEVDLAGKKFVRRIESGKGRQFYGHGVFSADGKILLTSEIRVGSGAGLIQVRDYDTMKVIGELPAYGDHPHDMRLMRDGAVLAVTVGHADGLSSVHCIDLRTKQLLKTIDGKSRDELLNHLAAHEDRIAVCINAQLAAADVPHTQADGLHHVAEAAKFGPARLLLGGLAGEAFNAEFPPELFGAMRGQRQVCISPQRSVIGVSNNEGSIAAFWSLDGKFLKSVSVAPFQPLGIATTPGEGDFVVFLSNGTMLLVNGRTLEPEPARFAGARPTRAEHYFSWSS
jgi:hypothetical protein